MGRRSQTVLAAAALVLGLVSAPAPSAAEPVDAFWSGERGTAWEAGIDSETGTSNWSTKPPPRGQPSRVPRNAAIFTKGARDDYVEIVEPDTRVDNLIVFSDAPKFTFRLKPLTQFRMTGGGLFNRSRNIPRIYLDREAALILSDEAALDSEPNLTSAFVRIADKAVVAFGGQGGAGRSRISNEGRMLFSGRASAQEMRAEQGGDATSVFPRIEFLDRADGGDAWFFNRANATLDFSGTDGPGRKGKLSAGYVVNNGGTLALGSNTLRIDTHYENGGQFAFLQVKFKGARVGNLYVEGHAELSGVLEVAPEFAGGRPPPGNYRILYAEGGRSGSLTLRTSISRARLAHGALEVVLIIE